MSEYLIALDQGTTSTRAMAFSPEGEVLDVHQIEFKQHYPKPGWVEHEAEEIWQTAVETVRTVVARQGEAGRTPRALGITNQRETVVIWDRKTGQPVHNAIVWQDRRTAEACSRLKEAGHEPMVQEKTGRLSRMDALQMQAMSAALEGRRQQDLKKIDAALKRLDEGEYGHCLKCGEAIAPGRLKSDPAAPLCAACAR